MRAEAPLKVMEESQSEAPPAVEVVSTKPEPVVHDDQQVSGVGHEFPCSLRLLSAF